MATAQIEKVLPRSARKRASTTLPENLDLSRSVTESLLDQLAQRLQAKPQELIRVAKRAIERAMGGFEPDTLWQLLRVQGDEHTARTFGRIGLSLRATEVMSLTGKSKSAIHKAKDENRLMAFRLPLQSTDLFPLLQFDGKEIRLWIPELLSHTGNGAAALQFLTARRTSLEGFSYAEKLIEQNFPATLIDALLEQAKRIGHAGA